MELIHLDFETFSEAPLTGSSSVGSWAYANHSSADDVSVAWAYGPNKPVLWTPYKPTVNVSELSDMLERVKRGDKITAWNAGFEYDFWNRCMVPKYGWPKLKKEQLIDTQAIALSLALPADLDTCAKILGMKELKDKEGKRLINKLTKPRRPSKLDPSTRWSYERARKDYDRFFEYNIQDVVVERDIFNRLKRFSLSEFEREMWLWTLEVNTKGIPIDIKTVKDIHFILSENEKKLKKEVVALTDGKLDSTSQRDKLLEILAEEGLILDDMREGTVKDALENIPMSVKAQRLLELRQLLSRSSTAKFERIINMIDSDNRVHNILRYHNCTTGRWGGAGIQLHALPRGDIEVPNKVISVINTRDFRHVVDLYPDIKSTCSSLVRSMILSDPGWRFLIADYSAIEAITISWMMDETQALQKVRAGLDIYKWYATVLYPNVNYEDITKAQRAHAKVSLLGLGYQMGVPTFIKSSEGYGIHFEYDEGKRMVDLYRSTFKNVVNSWYGLERAAIRCIKTAQTITCGKLEFSLEDNFLRMLLPSKRKISYPFPVVEPVETPWGERKIGITCWQRQQSTSKWIRKTVTPGKLIENAIQATARDIMAEAKLRLINRGYNVLFSVHDEIISHDPISFGSLKEMISIMCDTDPYRYHGLPISADGFAADRYRKG